MAQRAEVSGDRNQVNVVGRDLVFAETYVHEQSEFYRPNLKHFQSNNLIRPRIQPSLVQTILNQNMLVMGGVSDLDKLSLARHIAWDLIRNLSGVENDNAVKPLLVLEWIKSSNLQRLVHKLEETDERTIFILPTIEPQHISYDLSSIHKVAYTQKHYVLISTEIPFSMWHISDKDTNLWYNLPHTDIYKNEDLFGHFLDELFKVREALPTRILQRVDDGFQLGDDFEGKMRVIDIIQSLKTPDNITFFVQLLSAQKKELSEEAIEAYVTYSQNNQDVITRWFHQFLSRRDQMLAVGLCFFDGLFENQFFAALEQVIQQNWQYREPSLLALDYHDLEKLQHFCSLVDLEHTGQLVDIEHADRRIEIRNPEQRQTILNAAWDTHRRQIIASLPTLVSLVRQSVLNRSSHPELYGTREMRRQLRLVISDLLGHLGRMSPSAVEMTLLELAVDEDPGVQAVAARAMARLYEHGHHERLSATLHRWQTETRLSDMIDAIFQSRHATVEGGRAMRGRAYIRATIALTVGYAAAFDPPNQISPWLIELFVDLANDTHELVRQRFRNVTLRHVVSQHPLRLQEELQLLTRYVDLIQPIAASLALAYTHQPEHVSQMLRDWEKRCVDERPSRMELDNITLREALFATVVLTYGEIRYEGNSLMTAKQAVEIMGRVLNQERHPFVRNAVATAIARLSEHHFDHIEAELRNLAEQLKPDEIDTFVDRLTAIYMQQRQDLRGGDEQIKVGDHWYDTWLNPAKRPRTSIETATARWLGLPKEHKAYTLAIRAREAFLQALVITEVERAEEVEQERLERQTQEEEASTTSGFSEVVHSRLDYRSELRHLNDMRQNRPRDFEIYMNELKRDNAETARRLERDLNRMQQWWRIWIAVGIGVVIVGIIYAIYPG